MKTKRCAVSGKEFTIRDDDKRFYEKMGIPEPTFCPEERQRRRIAYRNFRSLYRRTCDATGKTVISMYHQDQPFPIYESEYWWGDAWSASDYAQEVQEGISFLDQYYELAQKVPRLAIFNANCENCAYSNFAWMSKNCYLVFGCVRNEDCLYGHIVWDCQNCVDNLYIFRCEWCSECIDCVDCYDLHFSTECTHCSESYFLHDCRSCKHCFGCTNLRNKEYYWFNQKLTRQEYEQKMKDLQPFSQEVLEQGRTWLEKEKKEQCVFPPLFGTQIEDCSGNHLYECKNCRQSFDAKKGEDSKFLYTSYAQENSYDISFTGDRTRYCCDSLTLFECEDCAFVHSLNNCDNAYYSEFCYNCSHIFGCNGLRNKKYCILNKQYSKEEYFERKEKLIQEMKSRGEWGEYFSIKKSPFAYNEAIVNEYYPLSKEEIQEQGLLWREAEETTSYDGPNVTVPSGAGESVDTDTIYTCSKTGKNYRVLNEEIHFYKRVRLPCSSICPDERHNLRMELRNPRKLYDHQCAECSCDIQTTYDSKRPEKILCEACYLKVVE